MAVGWLLTGCLPRALLPGLAARVTALTVRLQPGLVRTGIDRLCRRMPPGHDERSLFVEHLCRRHEHLLGRILDAHRRRWRPRIELEGAASLRTALAEGRGAVLWCMSFCGSLITKMALAGVGLPPLHLSTSYHGGLSRSWLAMHVLNRWISAVEDRYLAGRVVIPDGPSLDYLRRLRCGLASNAVVSIQGEHRGRRNVSIVVLGEEECVATGAPNLARRSGAALFTVSAHRPAPFEYRVVIEPLTLSFPSRAAVEEACHLFATRLEAAVLAHPEDWEFWSTGPLVP